jgi:hypothetical protein
MDESWVDDNTMGNSLSYISFVDAIATSTPCSQLQFEHFAFVNST